MIGLDRLRLAVTALADSVARPLQSTRLPQAFEHAESLRRSRAEPRLHVRVRRCPMPKNRRSLMVRLENSR